MPVTRQLGLGGAVILGVGSMVGAGIFSVWAAAAGNGAAALLLGLVLAALVAFCNAASSAQLAAQYPASGGTYVFGRERLGPWAGFLAGWGFVIGKTASAAAMALGAAAYLAPLQWQKPAALLAVLVLSGINALGITRTVAATGVLVCISLLGLSAAMGAAWVQPGVPWSLTAPAPGLHGSLQSAAFLFFAFAGYARLATLGEEVREPARTIPCAVMIALGLALALYAAVALSALHALGPAGLASTPAPLAAIAGTSGWGWAPAVVQIGAAAASLGALLALIAGISRTALAMARHRDLPHVLATVGPRFGVPQRAQALLTLCVCALVLLVDLRGAIGFSSFCVLFYYLVTNASAWTQPGPFRLYPRAVSVVGAAGCLALMFALPWSSIAGGLAVLAVGVLARMVASRRRATA